MKNTSASLYDILIHSTISKISYVFSILFWSALYVITGNYLILYFVVIAGCIYHLTLMGIIYHHKKSRKSFDIEIAVAITAVDYIIRFYFPLLSLINNILMFSFILLFLIRELKLPIIKNIYFLIGYGSFYFIASWKFIISLRSSYPIGVLAVIIMLTIVLSMVFAYSLLATATVRNFYRCSYCGAMAILCLIVLGRRMALSLDDTKFFIALISCLILLGIFYIYWYEGKEYYAEISGMRKKTFFYPGVLPNLVGATTFFLYIFNINLDDLSVVWGLLIAVSLWYLISVFYSLKNTVVYEDDAMACEELNEYQLKRLGKYAEHLRNQNSLKKKTIAEFVTKSED